MTNKSFSLLTRITTDLGVDVLITQKYRDRIIRRAVLDADERLMALIKRRLGVDQVSQEELSNRLHRVVARGYETLLLDGVPFARVYELAFAIDGPATTASQVIEELEG